MLCHQLREAVAQGIRGPIEKPLLTAHAGGPETALFEA